MKKILLILICAAIVVGLQLPKDKIALAGSLVIKQESSLVPRNLSEEDSKEIAAEKSAEKPVDSKTESTKKK